MNAAYDRVINLSRDFVPDLAIERKDDNTGDLEPYAGITGVTLLISATRGSSTPIHTSLSQSATERVDMPGQIYAVFDVADLRTHLLSTYLGKVVFLNVFKSGELQYEPFRCLVVKDRLGI